MVTGPGAQLCLRKREGAPVTLQALRRQQAGCSPSPGLIMTPAAWYQLRESHHRPGDTRAGRCGAGGRTQSRSRVCHSPGDMNQFPGTYSNADKYWAKPVSFSIHPDGRFGFGSLRKPQPRRGSTSEGLCSQPGSRPACPSPAHKPGTHLSPHHASSPQIPPLLWSSTSCRTL